MNLFFLKHRSWQVILVILMLALMGATVGISHHRALSGSSDFDVYYYAGRAALDSKPIYTIDRRAVNQSKSPFVYPPFFACFIAPFTLLPIGISAGLWNLLNLFWFGWCLFLIKHLVHLPGQRYPSKHNLGWYLLFGALTVFILFDNIAMAQVNILVFFLVLLGLNAMEQNRWGRAGFWIFAAAAIKLIPIIFFVYFAVKRKWRALAGGLGGFLFCFIAFPCLLVGPSQAWRYHHQWYEETLKDQATPLTLPFYSTQLNPSHQNLQAAFFRWVIDWEFRERTGGKHGKEFHYRPPIRLSERQASYLSQAVVLLMFFYYVFCIMRTRDQTKNRRLMVSCLTLISMILLAPKTRSHFFVFLLLPWAVLVTQVISGSQKRKAQFIFLSSAAFYLLQGFSYAKFLGVGSFTALVLFFYFTTQLNQHHGHDTI
ncbi:MAG: hypothetical protein COV74_04665 [Candidatus Omnitrophica bacterium CG11_big_fil_rev_8_21_14_0_20_45_26]|uniref:DUF2029 domain-containing protein n=1 Tax=Candidatus Abzuiibacterium crystallinum TaxID=1974748 RepID=A0A2H0LPY0_9BACT|nr:MAG: hypothetical protein COV74_04665 [Candidatus Omnitrophica bacterium CG11_big_fil_rev_8_21_14_0_20_45_26]PIW64055.1 MAG: hypothetical protein COW12_07790 [Candidatus Omnitrophica bacterium CG12_big_fil_rev_8_21_14_0_65_45_16]